MELEPVEQDSIRHLIRGLLGDLGTLIRKEISLAGVEVKEQAGRARAAAVSFGVAAAALVLGSTFLLVSIAIALADLLNWPLWAGFLAVAVALGLAGAVTLSAGRRKLKTIHPLPAETLSSLKENSEWIAKRLTSERR